MFGTCEPKTVLLPLVGSLGFEAVGERRNREREQKAYTYVPMGRSFATQNGGR